MSSTLPKVYKAAVVTTAGGQFEIVQKDLELPKEGQILVKVLACGVCFSDGMLKWGFAPLPRVAGHEIIGDVVATGPNERRWKNGDRVGGGWHGGHCHECTSCKAGDYVTCSKANINGITTDGGYAEYVILRTEAVVSVSKDVDPASTAPLLCAGVTTFNSLRNMDLKQGDLVAVHGIGGLGHLAIQFAHKMGCHVIALSQSGKKEQLALKLGANTYLNGSEVDFAAELTKMGGAKVIVCTAPNGEAIKSLLDGLKVGGTMLTLAVTDISFSTVALIGKRSKVQGWPSGHQKDSEEALAFAQSKEVKCIIEKFKLEDAEDAFNKMLSGQTNIRAVLIP